MCFYAEILTVRSRTRRLKRYAALLPLDAQPDTQTYRRNKEQGTNANCEQNATVSVWLYEQLSIRIEGKIRVCPSATSTSLEENELMVTQGFDEFMNLVLDDAVEVRQVTKTNEKESRRPLGKLNSSPAHYELC